MTFCTVISVTAIAIACIVWAVTHSFFKPDNALEQFIETISIATVVAVPMAILMAQNNLALSRHQQELEALATTDPLTQLLNRRAFMQMLKSEQQRMARLQTSAAIVFIDIDRFKAVNDEFGHRVGDHVLQELAAIVRMSLRPSIDFVGRWGGEEFVVLLSDITPQHTAKVCERLRQKVESRRFTTGGRELNVTASFGWARFLVDSDIEGCIERADKAVYEAKNRGRNQVYSPHQMTALAEGSSERTAAA